MKTKHHTAMENKEIESLEKYGRSLIGKKAQSRLLTTIGKNGNSVLESPQLITGYEIVEYLKEPQLMVTIGGKVIYEDLLINIQ